MGQVREVFIKMALRDSGVSGKARLYQHTCKQGPCFRWWGPAEHYSSQPSSLFFSGLMKIWRRLPPCVHLGAVAPYWAGLGAQTLIFFSPSQGHCNGTIAGGVGEESGILTGTAVLDLSGGRATNH